MRRKNVTKDEEEKQDGKRSRAIIISEGFYRIRSGALAARSIFSA